MDETNVFGCESNSSVNINFLEQPNINILEDTTYGCEDENIIVEGNSTNASPILDNKWKWNISKSKPSIYRVRV